ncbi:MAG: universal stress protein [Streptococcaceae bacterium]|jgi:nucleotide-binding universal stress UspA family protein|nr:universal stress protein [Streptococcaceae bacterium]
MENIYNKILVGLDGSAESLKAFDRAITVAKLNNAELILVNVIELRSFQAINIYDSVSEKNHEDGAKILLEQFADEAKQAGVKQVTTLLEYGSPRVMMATKIPKKLGIDLIIVGATGMSYLERIVIGSTTSYIIAHSSCDTLIVRR